jgi:hypothetical protein
MSDAPDWQRIVALTTSVGQVTDAPDWERVVVGSGGTPVGGGGLSYYTSVLGAAVQLGKNPAAPTLVLTTGSIPTGYYYAELAVTLSAYDASQNYVWLAVGTAVLGGSYVPTVSYCIPNTSAGFTFSATASGIIQVTVAGTLELVGIYTGVTSAVTWVLGTNNSGAPAPQIPPTFIDPQCTTLTLLGPL